MKKSMVSTIITWMLVVNMAFGFGWFADIFKNIITTRTTVTTFVGNGMVEEHVTIRNVDKEIIDEYVVIREQGS